MDKGIISRIEPVYFDDEPNYYEKPDFYATSDRFIWNTLKEAIAHEKELITKNNFIKEV